MAAPLRLSRAAARCVRRSRLSARPGRAAQAHQATAVGRLARGRRRAARRIGAAVDAGPRGRGRRRRCRRKSRPRSSCSASTASASCRTICPSCSSGQGLRKFLEQTLIPLNEAVHERVVRGEMQNFQELRFADLAQRLLRDVTRLVRPTRDARQILLATPPERSQPARPRDPRAAAVHRRHQLPDARRRRARAGNRRRRRSLQGRRWSCCCSTAASPARSPARRSAACARALPADMPLIVSGRAVNLLAKPIDERADRRRLQLGDGHDARAGRAAAAPLTRVGDLPDASQRGVNSARVNPRPTMPRRRWPNRPARATRGRRFVWHAIGARCSPRLSRGSILRGYRQPDLLLDLADMRLCA